ncbi:MAG: hypothetical protein M0Z71_01325 [Nitrospiraceae bacterium]|nr:hypothetical protein [Nitrospiraceae bacterium]
MFKKYIILGLIVLIMTAFFFAVSVRNAASIVRGGYHDLTNNSGIGGFASYSVKSDVCVFCHTPHHANSNQTYSGNPITGTGTAGSLGGSYLWNRRVPLASSFTPYSSSTFAGGQPGPLSLLCLSCHDGVGAMNVLLNYPNNTPIPAVIGPLADQFGDATGDPSWAALNIGDASCNGDDCGTTGGNLQNDHPIGFDYDAAQQANQNGLNIITNTALLDRMAITQHRMECNTCHDPHITNDLTTKNNFLVIDNKNSLLCLACHNK